MHLDPGQRVERAERLVEQQQARAADQGARQRHALPLAAREHRRPVVGAVGEADVAQSAVSRRRAPAGLSRAMPTLSITRCQGSSRASWNSSRTVGCRPATCAPPIGDAPSLARSRPASRRSSVVLPPPERPTTATNWPAGTSGRGRRGPAARRTPWTTPSGRPRPPACRGLAARPVRRGLAADAIRLAGMISKRIKVLVARAACDAFSHERASPAAG